MNSGNVWMRAMREACGLTINEAARCAGISGRLLAGLEEGWTTIPQLALDVARAYGMTAEELEQITCRETLERHRREHRPGARAWQIYMTKLRQSGERPRSRIEAAGERKRMRAAWRAAGKRQCAKEGWQAADRRALEREYGDKRPCDVTGYVHSGKAEDSARKAPAKRAEGCKQAIYQSAGGTLYKVARTEARTYQIMKRSTHGWRPASTTMHDSAEAAQRQLKMHAAFYGLRQINCEN